MITRNDWSEEEEEDDEEEEFYLHPAQYFNSGFCLPLQKGPLSLYKSTLGPDKNHGV